MKETACIARMPCAESHCIPNSVSAEESRAGQGQLDAPIHSLESANLPNSETDTGCHQPHECAKRRRVCGWVTHETVYTVSGCRARIAGMPRITFPIPLFAESSPNATNSDLPPYIKPVHEVVLVP